MRRPRRRLSVSTFPFLAVLLCAMGSLILLMLVMDRRAKAVARAKALQAIARLAAEDERVAAERAAELERRRQALHDELLNADQKAKGEIQKVQSDMEVAAQA